MNKFSFLSLSVFATAILFTPMSAQAMVVDVPVAAPGTEGLNVVVSGGVGLSLGSTSNVGGGIVEKPLNMVTDNTIIGKYLGTTASFTDILYLMIDNDRNHDVQLFNNKSSAVNSTVSLGNFADGTILNFRLHVNETGKDFFTGNASLNPDGRSHARVQQNYGGLQTTLVSFEDWTDFNYSDLSFSFTPTRSSALSRVPASASPQDVPEPFTIVGTLVGATAAFRIKKKLADSDKV
jgi:hypothetical protein